MPPVPVFISYARPDEADARRLAGDLRQDGYSVWLDVEQLLPGDQWEQAIHDALAQSSYCVVLLSPRSLEAKRYVSREMESALAHGSRLARGDRFFLPARLEPVELSDERLTRFHYVDLFPDWADGVKRLEMAMPTPELSVSKRSVQRHTFMGAVIPIAIGYALLVPSLVEAFRGAPFLTQFALLVFSTVLPTFAISAIITGLMPRRNLKSNRSAFIAGLMVGSLLLFFFMMMGGEP